MLEVHVSRPYRQTHVYLNVYDLTPANGYFYWAGLGVFHTGIEGSLCNYILPKALKTSAVRHDPNFQGYDIEKKRLTRSFSCFSSISMHQRERQVSISSLFLHSQYKGCLPPWELKKSRNGSSKEE
ncbi:hypothetical protein Vadar_024936 [Vaccinium darrowii]|uniref:Uncharacterized protein n=1 Tax=Vaccinium darrowii TaxID=229202 RepID=A0ACB7X459_9ERIC|nr:hypothetical protein Vadar_024936 [Vaccinium darrowii]